MGKQTFLLPPGLSADVLRELERACVAGGQDNMPWPTETRIENGRLIVRRGVDESGYLVVPWDIDGAGRLMGTSATLMERAQPYHFQIELARGKINQLRCQAADWELGGLQIPPELEQKIREAGRTFGKAIAVYPSEQAGPLAQQALTQAYQAADELVHVYIEQAFQIRHQRQPRFETILGCRLGAVVPEGEEAAALGRACNGVAIPFCWSDVEPEQGTFHWEPHDELLDWAAARGLQVTAGPLIDFSSARLPGWLWLWERDLPSLATYMCQYVEQVVKRYRKRIRRWQITAASNWANVLSLGEDELLWLTVRLAEVARQIDPTLELIVGIAQPWGEYMALEDRIQSPFIFADTLIRSALNLSALDIEIIMGVAPRGSYCRDLLETWRMLNLYVLLGVPLRVTLGYPAAKAPDPRADPDQCVVTGHWHGGYSPAIQADWASDFAALALCRPQVQAVHWVHLSDAHPHQFPHCGLFDAKGNPRPVLQRLQALREQHLS
ncbi:MAG TPA: endo-1,4-beta-xylanase [Gemmataceae bacterium]|nr:endo-1,4-beta-xylanase [Gemmataceae bacterium]